MTGDRTPDSPDERRVRDALHDTVDDLEPVSGLAAIRSRVQEDAMSAPRSRAASRSALLALGGAAAVAVVVTGVVLVTQQSDRTGSEPPPAGTTSRTPAPTSTSTPTPTSTPSPTDGASPSPSGDASTPAEPPTARALPVYYVGDGPTGPVLYREFHDVAITPGTQLQAALEQAVSQPPLDPDYRVPWPSGTGIGSADVDGDGQFSVSLTGDVHDRPVGMSEAEAAMAVQQLIYTAQAVGQTRAPVQLLIDGRHTDQVLGVPASEPLANADELSTTSTVWITSPQDGAKVPAGDLTVQGRGAFFEATVVWQLLQGGKVVATGSGMSQECCRLAPYTLTIPDVKPGDYVLRVYDEDMSGGESGHPEPQDTKRLTVR